MTRPADILPERRLIAVLGAGRASRYGSDKLSQPCAGKPLGRWALDAALGTGLPVVWIAGETVPTFVTAQVITNPRADQGMGTSVACAAHHAREIGAEQLLIMLADMPLVTSAMLEGLLAKHAPAAAAWKGKPGVPALFTRDKFSQLENLTGPTGAAAMLRELEGLSLMAVPEEQMCDVDTPQDLAEVEALLLRR